MLRYRLKELMYKKYGVQKFALACEIVARWLKFRPETLRIRCTWNQEMVQEMCDCKMDEQFALYADEAELLRRLFGLKSVEELFFEDVEEKTPSSLWYVIKNDD